MPADPEVTDPDRIPVSAPYLWGGEEENVVTALRNGWLSARGPFVAAFEERFASYLGVRHAVAVTNGTAAVHLALTASGIAAGDEVIVPDFCMIAPIMATLYCNATPVPVDVDETWNLDPSLLEERITPRTRAILVVHNYGHPADMRRIVPIARRHGLRVVEDGAEALGATVAGQMVGSLGDVACFSFYANKTITTGEGGMVVTDDAELARTARWQRDMCFGEDQETRFIHRSVGFNYRLTNLQAGIGLAQLEHVEQALAERRRLAGLYREALAEVPGLVLPPSAPWARHGYWVFGVLVEPAFGRSRAALQEHLLAAGIETRRFFHPVHGQPIVHRQAEGAAFANADRLSGQGLYLPLYMGMTDAQLRRVVSAIRSCQIEATGSGTVPRGDRLD